MPSFDLQVTGVSHETYRVDAASPEEAQAMFERGELTKPVVSEVEGGEVERVVLTYPGASVAEGGA